MVVVHRVRPIATGTAKERVQSIGLNISLAIGNQVADAFAYRSGVLKLRRGKLAIIAQKNFPVDSPHAFFRRGYFGAWASKPRRGSPMRRPPSVTERHASFLDGAKPSAAALEQSPDQIFCLSFPDIWDC